MSKQYTNSTKANAVTYQKFKKQGFIPTSKKKKWDKTHTVVLILILLWSIGSILGTISFIKTCKTNTSSNVAYADEVDSLNNSFIFNSVPITLSSYDLICAEIDNNFVDYFINSLPIDYVFHLDFNRFFNVEKSYANFTCEYNLGASGLLHIFNPTVVNSSTRLDLDFISNENYTHCEFSTDINNNFPLIIATKYTNGVKDYTDFDSTLEYSDIELNNPNPSNAFSYNIVNFYFPTKGFTDTEFYKIRFISNVEDLTVTSVGSGYTYTIRVNTEYICYLNDYNESIIFSTSTLSPASLPYHFNKDYTRYIIEDLTDNNFYQNGYNNGFNNGYGDGFDTGKLLGYNEGFAKGKLDGVASANEYSFLGLLSAVIDAPIQALGGLLNFTILGINMVDFFYGILTLCLFIAVCKIVIKSVV